MRGYHSNSVPFSEAAQYATWDADEVYRYVSATHSVGMKVCWYTNPDREYSCSGCSSMYSSVVSNPSTMAKSCDGMTITIATNKGCLTDPRAPELMRIWQKQNEHDIQAVLPDHWDAIFEDDETPPYYTDFNGQSETSGVPCGYTPSTWRSAQKAMTAAQANISNAVPILVNGLFVWHGSVAGSLSLLKPSNVIGGMLENCYVGKGLGHPGTNPIYDPFWSQQA